MASRQPIESYSIHLTKSPSTPARSRLSTPQIATRLQPQSRPFLLGSSNPSSRGPGSLRILRSNSTTLPIGSSEQQVIPTRRQRAKEIDIGTQICLPAPATVYNKNDEDTQVVLIHNLDTPTVSLLSLCIPTIPLSEIGHINESKAFEKVDTEISIKFLIGTLKSIDLQLNRANVDVHLIAKSNGSITPPETIFSDILDQSSELDFYKIKLNNNNLVLHKETYSVPISRLFLVPNKYTQAEHHLVNCRDNPFLIPSTINETLFTVTNPFTRQSMEVLRNPLLDTSSRASLQSREALIYSSKINLHGINNSTSPYHERRLMNASRLLVNATPQMRTPSETTSVLQEMSISCTQDKALGSIMDDFTLQRATIEKRVKNTFHSTVRSKKQCRSYSLPQKLSNIPILTDGEFSIDDLSSAKDIIESELSDALTNDFIKSIIPEPCENFYTICNWKISKPDSFYDITVDTGYLQHPLFLRTLKCINAIAQEINVPAERLKQLQLDYLHEYKLHLTAVYNRHTAKVQNISFSLLTELENNNYTMTEAQLLQITTQLNIINLLRHAPISLCTHYSRYSLNCIRDELIASNDLSKFSSTIEARYPLAFKPVLAQQSSMLRYFKAITALRNCITWGCSYRSTILPVIQDTCSRTDQLIKHFFNSDFSMIVSTLQRLLIQLKTEISDLSSLYLQCVCDCNPESDLFLARLRNVYPENRDLLSELAVKYMKNIVHVRTYNYNKVLEKLKLAADLIVHILLRECTDQFLCMKSLLFLYWRSIVPFQLIIMAGTYYYHTISYLINLEFQKHYYSEENNNEDVYNRENTATRAVSRISTRQTIRESAFTKKLLPQISLPNPKPTDSYNDYIDACIKQQYATIPYWQTLDESNIPLACHNLCVKDVFGLISKDDYDKIVYNPSCIGLKRQIRIVLSSPLRTLPDTFLAISRHLSAAMYPVLLDFAHLFNTIILSSTDISDQRHVGERKAIKRLKRGRKTLATKVRCHRGDNIELSDIFNSSDGYEHDNEPNELEMVDSEDTNLCVKASCRYIHEHNNSNDVNNLMFSYAPQVILHRFYHLGFISSNPSFKNVLYRITLNLTIQFTRYLHRFTYSTNIPDANTSYIYYIQSMQQLENSVCKLRNYRDDARKMKKKIAELAMVRDSDQLCKNKSLTIDDLYSTAKTDNAQLYASLAVLDERYAEKLKSVKIPLDYELRQVVWEMNDASRIFSEEDFKLTKHSVQQRVEAKQPDKTVIPTDDLELLLEKNRLDISNISSSFNTHTSSPTIVTYSQPHSLTDVTNPALLSDLASSLLISYVPQIECSLVPLWNLALDISTIFFTLPIMVSLYFDYFFPVGPNLKIRPRNPASPDKNTNALSLSILDFYSDTPQDDSVSNINSLPSSTRKSTSSAGKLVPTDKQTNALKHFYSMGIFPSNRLEGEVIGFLRQWNGLLEGSSLSTLLSTQEQLVLPKSDAFQGTILEGSCLQKLYVDTSPFSLITGTVAERFGYCSFLNVTSYNLFDCRTINDRFEGIASTARLVIDTITGELMAESCYSTIQSSLTSSSMKKVFAYITKYGKDVTNISLYNPGTMLYSYLGNFHMWRAPKLNSEFILQSDNINYLDHQLLSTRSFLDIKETDTSNALIEYSILQPQFSKIIPKLDFSIVDQMLDSLSLYAGGFNTLPVNIYQTIFVISLHEFKQSMASLLTYYKYLYLYVHYAALVLVINTVSLEMDRLEKDLERCIDSPDSILAQHNLLQRLSEVRLSELYTYIYTLSITQYEGLCTRFQDTRSVFTVNELEDSAFLLLERILYLKERQHIATELFKQRVARFSELTTVIEDWLGTVTGILFDHMTTISSMVSSISEDYIQVSLASHEEQSLVLQKVILPHIYRSKKIDNLPPDNDADSKFFNNLFNVTSLLSFPSPDLDASVLLQSMCSNDIVLKALNMNDNIIQYKHIHSHISSKNQHNVLTDKLSLSQFLSCLYYISTELLPLDKELRTWRSALISIKKEVEVQSFPDPTPSLHSLHLCIQVYYLIFIYSVHLDEFLQYTRSWEISMFSPFIPTLYSVLNLALNAAQVFSLWTQPLPDNLQYFSDTNLDPFTKKNVFLQDCDLPKDIFSLYSNGFSVKATNGSTIKNIILSSWKKWILSIQSSLQRSAIDILCLDLLCTKSFTNVHRKSIHSYLHILDTTLIGDILVAIHNTPCALEFLAYLYLDAQADNRAIIELEEAEKLLKEIIISLIDYVYVDPPPMYANQRSQNLHNRNISEYQIPVVFFLPKDVSANLSKCESILASVASRPRQCQTKIPIEEADTLKGSILSNLQSSQCLPLTLLPHTNLLLRTTYSNVVHRRIKDLRNALSVTSTLYHGLICIPRLFKYALTMYGHGSFIEASMVNRGVRSMAEHPTLLYSMNVLTMYEATTLFNMHGQYSSLISSKFAAGTPLVCYAANVSTYKLINSLSKDLKTIVHRVITAPHFSLFSKLLNNTHQSPKIPNIIEHQEVSTFIDYPQSFSPNISLCGKELQKLKYLVPYINGSHQFRGVLFPMWAPLSHECISSTSNVSAYSDWFQKYIQLNITILIAPSFSNKRHQITDLSSKSETLSLIQPVKCPTQLYSFLDTLSEPISSALLHCTSQALKEVLQIVAIMDTFPLQLALDTLSLVYLLPIPSCKTDLAFELHTLINSIVTVINSFVYDSLRIAISTILKMLLEQQLKSVTPMDFLENYKNSIPVLQRSYLFLRLILFALKVRTGSSAQEKCRDPLVLMSNKACKDILQIKHDAIYRDALYIWIVEQYMFLLMLEHDLFIELKREQSRDKTATTHLLNAVLKDKSLAHTHASYLSTNTAFEFIGKHMDDYLKCTIYPMLFLQFSETNDDINGVSIILSNDMNKFKSSIQWLGAPQMDDLYCAFPPQLQISILRVLESLKRKNTVFLLLDKISRSERYSLPYVILRRISRLLLHHGIILFISRATFETDIINLMIYLAAGLLVGILGFELLEAKQRSMMMHILEELQYPTSSIPGLAVVSPISEKARETMESLEFGEKWSSMTIDDQGNLLSTYMTLRNARVSDVLSQSREMGRVVVFLYCLIPTQLNSIEIKTASSTQSHANDTNTPLIDQFVYPFFVDKTVQSILNDIFNPELVYFSTYNACKIIEHKSMITLSKIFSTQWTSLLDHSSTLSIVSLHITQLNIPAISKTDESLILSRSASDSPVCLVFSAMHYLLTRTPLHDTKLESFKTILYLIKDVLTTSFSLNKVDSDYLASAVEAYLVLKTNGITDALFYRYTIRFFYPFFSQDYKNRLSFLMLKYNQSFMFVYTAVTIIEMLTLSTAPILITSWSYEFVYEAVQLVCDIKMLTPIYITDHAELQNLLCCKKNVLVESIIIYQALSVSALQSISSTVFRPFNNAPILVLVSNTLYQQCVIEINYLYDRHITLSFMSRCAPHDMEMLFSAIPYKKYIDNDRGNLLECVTNDNSCSHLSLVLNPSVRGLDLQTEIGLLLSNQNPSFIISFPSLSQITAQWIAERSIYSFTRIARSSIQRVYNLVFKLIFPYCLQGITEIVRKEFLLVFGDEQKLLAVAPTKLITSIIWYNFVKYNLIQCINYSSNEESFGVSNSAKSYPDNTDIYSFQFSPSTYEAYLSGEFTAFYKIKDTCVPSKYGYLPSFSELNLSIPTQSELFTSYVDTIQQIYSESNAQSFIFCKKMIESLFHAPATAVLGLMQLLVLIFCAAWNAYSLVYLATKIPHIDQPEVLPEIYQVLCLSMNRLLTLFCIDQDVKDHNIDSTNTTKHMLSNHLLSALRITTLLDMWKKGVNAPMDTMSYEQRDQYILLNEYINTLLNGKKLSLHDSIWNMIGITISNCISAFTSTASTNRHIFENIIQHFTISQSPTLSDVFRYVFPSIDDDASGRPRMTLLYVSYKIGQGFMSALSCSSEAQLLDCLSLDGTILYEIKKAIVKKQCKKIHSENLDNKADQQSRLLRMRKEIAFSAVSYAYGIGSSYQTSIQKPLSSTLLIDEPRAALVVLIAACAFSAVLYPTGVCLEVCGNKGIGKTALIEIAELLIEDLTGPWSRLPDVYSVTEAFTAAHTYPNKLSRWRSSVFHIPKTWERDQSIQSHSSSPSSLLSRKQVQDNRFDTFEKIGIMNTTLITERVYDSDVSIKINKEMISPITISLPGLTLDHVLSLIQLAFSSNKKVYYQIIHQTVLFLFSKHKDLFSNYSFLSSLQRYLFWIPSLEHLSFKEDKIHKVDQEYECHCHTMHLICSALRDVPEMSNSKLVSILDGLLSTLDIKVLNLRDYEVWSPSWQIITNETYSKLSNKKDLRTIIQDQDKVNDNTIVEGVDQLEDSTLEEYSQSTNRSIKQTGKTIKPTIELHNLKTFYCTCNATKVEVSDSLCASINILLQKIDQNNSDIADCIEYSTRQTNSMWHDLGLNIPSNIDLLCKANLMDILSACGCAHVNLEWTEKFPRYFELCIMDLYLEYTAYERQLAEAKTRNISPPENPQYISPSLAVRLFEIYTESKARKEYGTKMISCLRNYLLASFPCTCYTNNLYTWLRRLFLWSMFMSPRNLSRQLINSLDDYPEEYLKRYIDIFKRIKEETISDSFFDESTEHIIDELFSLRDDSQLSCSPVLTANTLDIDKESLRSSRDLRLSDLNETFNVRNTSMYLMTLNDNTHAQLYTSSLLPINLAKSTITIPCYRLYSPFIGHKQFQQMTYLIQVLGGYTPFLELKFEHLYSHTSSKDDVTFSITSERPSSSRTGANTPVYEDSAKDRQYQQRQRILINIDAILAAISHVSAGEKEKGVEKSSQYPANNFVKSVSISVLEISAHLPDFDSDFIATFILLRTAICLAAGVNPIYFLYTINHAITHSNNQFGLLASLAQNIFYTSKTRYFDSIAGSGFRSTPMYTDEPLLSTHFPSVLSVPGYLESYIMHVFNTDSNAISEFTHRFEQGGGTKSLLEQGEILLNKYFREPSCVTVLSSIDTLMTTATGWPALSYLLDTSINPGNFIRKLFTPEEISIILTSLSINAGFNRHLRVEELQSILASNLQIYILHSNFPNNTHAITSVPKVNYFGIERVLRSPDDLFDGSLTTFFTSLSQSFMKSTKIIFPTVNAISTNPLLPVSQYTAEQLLIYCKVNLYQLSKIANLPDQLRIDWNAHKVAVLLTCLSLHKACCRLSSDWYVPLQSFIKLTVDMIGVIFSRAQQYYANINSITSLYKIYTCMTNETPPDGLKTHDALHPELYLTYFSNTKDSILPIESISLKYLQYFTGNLVSQDSKAFGELCYMRNCLYSCLQTCKTHSRQISSILRQVCYEVPILVACMLYGITGLLDKAATGDPDITIDILEILVKALQQDGLTVTLPSTKCSIGTSTLSKEFKLFAIWNKHDLQYNTLFFKYFQFSTCLDTPVFMTEIIFKETFNINEIYRHLLYAGVLYGFLGRRIFLTYSALAQPLVFTLMASIRRFDIPFCCLYETLIAASNTTSPIHFIKLKNQALYKYIHQIKERKVVLSVCQPYRHFCTAIAKALAESDKAIIFADIGSSGASQNNYSVIRKLLLLATTTRVDARQQVTLGSQVTYLFQPLSEYIFIISLSQDHYASFMPVSVLHIIQEAGMNRANMLESITFLCNLSSSPKCDHVQIERAEIADMLTGSVFGSEFTRVLSINQQHNMFAKLFLSLTNLVDTFHSYLLEYGADALSVDNSFRSERTIMTLEAYTQRRTEIEKILSKFMSSYSNKSGNHQGTIGDYQKLTCASSNGKKIISSVSTLLDILREVCLLFYILMPPVDNMPPLLDLHTRRKYSIGDEPFHFSIDQSVNILNELQIGYFLRTCWYTWIEKCAELAWDLLHYLRTLTINDPPLLIETNKATLTALHEKLCNYLTSYYNGTIKVALKKFFSIHSLTQSTNAMLTMGSLSDSQDDATLSSSTMTTLLVQPNIIADLITFRYDSLKYPILYYTILYPHILIDVVIQFILSYVLSRLASPSTLKHIKAHKLFIILYTLSMSNFSKEPNYVNNFISEGDLEAAILENKTQMLIAICASFEQEKTSDIDLELLSCICPKSLEEMSSFIYSCLLSSQKYLELTNTLNSTGNCNSDKFIPVQFCISREAKQLFLSCITISQLSKGSIDLLPYLTENTSAILVCSQYSCLLVTLLSLYLVDVDARTALESLLDSNSSVAKERCVALEQHVTSLMDVELEKDRKHLSLAYVPPPLQKPTISSMYLAFLLSILLRPESFNTASTLLFHLLERYTQLLVAGPNQPESLSIFLSDQRVQRAHFPLTLYEEGCYTSPIGVFQVGEGNIAIPQSCTCDSFISLSRAAHSMMDATLTLLSKRRELLLLTSTNQTGSLSLQLNHDDHTSSSTEAAEEIIEQCRFHFPMTIVFCEGELFSINDIYLVINQSNYNNKTNYPFKKVPFVYQFPSSLIEFHQHSTVCILSNYECLFDELEHIIHLVIMHQQLNTIGVPALPIWLVIPRDTFKRAISTLGSKLVRALEHLIHLIRPIVITYKTPSVPSELCKITLTRYFLQKDASVKLDIHQLDSMVIGLLHTCTHEIPQTNTKFWLQFNQYLAFIVNSQHSSTNTSLPTLLFIRNLNILLFFCSRNLHYSINSQSKYAMQSVLDYYITVKALKIKGNISLFGEKSLLWTKVYRPQVYHRWRKSNINLIEKEKPVSTSRNLSLYGAHSKKLSGNPSSVYYADAPYCSESSPRLLNYIMTVMCLNRVVDDTASPTIIFELPSQVSTEYFTISAVLSVFDNILKEIITKEHEFSLNSPQFGELLELRDIINRHLKVSKKFAPQFPLKGNTSMLLLQMHRDQRYSQSPDLSLAVSMYSIISALIQAPSKSIYNIERRILKISPDQEVYGLLTLLRLSLASHENVPLDKIYLFAFLHQPFNQLYLTNNGVLAFTSSEESRMNIELPCFPICLQLTDLIFSWGAYDSSLQSLTFATAEQEQGYSHNIIIYIVATAMPMDVSLSTLQIPGGYIPIPIQIDYLPVGMLILPQNESIQIKNTPVLNINSIR